MNAMGLKSILGGLFRRKKKKTPEQELPPVKPLEGANEEANAWPSPDAADTPNVQAFSWPTLEESEGGEPDGGGWDAAPDSGGWGESADEGGWPSAEGGEAEDPGANAWPSASDEGSEEAGEGWPAEGGDGWGAPEGAPAEGGEPEEGKKKKKKKKRKKRKEKAPAEGEEGGKKKKPKLLLILLPVVALVAAAAVLLILKPWAAKDPPPEDQTGAEEQLPETEVGGEEQEPPADSGEAEDEPSGETEAPPAQPSAPQSMDTAHAIEHFSALDPASLGLEGSSMSEYRYYATGKTVTVDGKKCREIMVYSESESSKTNSIEGRYLLSMDATRLYRDDGNGAITELSPSVIGIGG